MGKISSACKAAAKRKFKVWPSAYASGWGVRCTKAGGPSRFGGGKKKCQLISTSYPMRIR